jgi:hypothetical protein
MVLADPRLVIAEVIEPLDQFDVTVDGEGWIFAKPVEWGEEDTEGQAAMGHEAMLRDCVVGMVPQILAGSQVSERMASWRKR